MVPDLPVPIVQIFFIFEIRDLWHLPIKFAFRHCDKSLQRSIAVIRFSNFQERFLGCRGRNILPLLLTAGNLLPPWVYFSKNFLPLLLTVGNLLPPWVYSGRNFLPFSLIAGNLFPLWLKIGTFFRYRWWPGTFFRLDWGQESSPAFVDGREPSPALIVDYSPTFGVISTALVAEFSDCVSRATHVRQAPRTGYRDRRPTWEDRQSKRSAMGVFKGLYNLSAGRAAE